MSKEEKILHESLLACEKALKEFQSVMNNRHHVQPPIYYKIVEVETKLKDLTYNLVEAIDWVNQ